MIVYCNGDSFISGSELGDNILPEYPGLLDFPWDSKSNSTHRQYEQWYLKSQKPDNNVGKERLKNQFAIGKLDFERAFPNKIKQLLGVKAEVINHAKPGTSNERIIRSTMSDLLHLSKTHKDIVAVIGTTGLARSEVATDSFYEIDHRQGIPYVWRCISTIYKLPNDPDELNCLIDYKLRYETNYHQYVNFYRQVILLQDFCKLNNIKLLWVSTLENHTDIKIEKRFENARDLKNFVEYANLTYSVYMAEIAGSIISETVCPSGHFSEAVHQAVADQLVVKIQQIIG